MYNSYTQNSLFYKRLLSVLCAILIPLSSTFGAYKIEDLEQLAKNKEFREFFLHAKDIVPQNRGDRWEKLIKKSADQYLTTFDPENLIVPRIDFDIFMEIQAWPAIRSNETLLLKLNQYSLFYLESEIKLITKKSEQEIVELKNILHQFWKNNKQFFNLGYQIALSLYAFKEEATKPQSALTHLISPYPDFMAYLYLFTEQAYKSPVSHVFCDSSMSQNIISYKFQELLEKQQTLLDDNFDIKISQFVNRKCWETYRPYLFEIISQKNSAHDKKEMAFKLIQLDRSLPSEQKTFAAILYLLDGPQKSELYNLSWNRLMDLKKEPESRNSIAAKISNLDPVPDNLFSQTKNIQHILLTKNLAQYFPELFESYSSKCLEYLEGKGSFKKGNPTIHCKDLFLILRGLHQKDEVAPRVYYSLKPYFKDIK
ncbi:MAG: hypothetical protein H6621_01390 [Halobacteriovoraceae bacterium]|nr:hypothetical protein [Halobacteriovoraceae bacterium]